MHRERFRQRGNGGGDLSRLRELMMKKNEVEVLVDKRRERGRSLGLSSLLWWDRLR